ncbi:MAG TPA: EVE domain-containing protein [Casimicrobiaceae bacterium]|nr:EVE domain-containing protein [Casimicrobiaceae bacterium]
MIDARPQQPQYWIAVVAQDRAARARDGGYAELTHGRAGILELMRTGDGFVTYSPRASDARGNPVQAFTSLGYVRDGVLYRANVPDGSSAFRVAIDYVPGNAAPIRPLIESLTFIRNPQHWGAAFRFGALRIGSADFARIAIAMGHAPDVEQVRAA